jgi:hypothetical protein
MNKTVWTSAIVLACSISTTAFAQSDTGFSGDCSYPDRPAIADGNTATEAQMIDSQKAMKAYLALGNDFLACLEKEEVALNEKMDITPELKEEQRARLITTHNAVVDDMNAVAEAFNTSLRAFKSKNK